MSFGNVHLTPQLVQAVRDAVDVLDIAGRHTRLEKKGQRYWGLCPFHKEKTPSFSVDPTPGLYYCFGCGAGGDAIGMHMAMTGDEFPEAIEALAREYGIPLPSRAPGRSGGPVEPDLEEVLLRAERFFCERLAASPAARGYLDDRRISAELIESFHLGYAPDDFQALLGELSGEFPVRDLEAAGLVGRSERAQGRAYDRFRNRLMFPIRNPSGRLLGFGGRTLGDDRAKYINTRETDRFRKRTVLYGLDVTRRAVREEGVIVLVEGYFDLLAVVASGVGWAAATMGTALSAEQARLCSRYADRVVMCYDADSAGQEAQSRALPILLSRGLEVGRVDLGSDGDPDTLRLEQGEKIVAERVAAASDAVEWEIGRLLPPPGERDPAAQSRSAKALRSLLEAVPDSVLRFGYTRVAADRLGVPQELLQERGRRSPGSDLEAEDQRPEQKLVTSLEERTLQLLLAENAELPPLEELPPEEVFLDASCGNIFREFCALYAEGETPPDTRAVLAGLSHEGHALDRVARILLERQTCSVPQELEECLRRLNRRWRQHRLKALALQIKEAQRNGDVLRLQALVEEKTSLTQLLHELTPPSPGAGLQRSTTKNS